MPRDDAVVDSDDSGGGDDPGVGPGAPDPVAPPLRRLSASEYNQTIAALAGQANVDGHIAAWAAEPAMEYRTSRVPWPWVFPATSRAFGFEGMVAGEVSSSALIEAYQSAAAFYAPWMVDSPLRPSCDLDDDDLDEAESCSWASAAALATAAWRRPLDDDTSARLRAFWRGNVDAVGARDGFVATVEGILQAPGFLYLPPVDDALDGHGVASRLSYLLWDAPPDDVLLSAAADGSLDTAEGIRKQARRMLDDPRAHEALVGFHWAWLHFDEVRGARPLGEVHFPTVAPEIAEGVEQDPRLFREVWALVANGLRWAVEDEAERFLEAALFEQGRGSVSDLFTMPHGRATLITSDRGGGDIVIDVRTGELYGATDVDEGSGPVASWEAYDVEDVFSFQVYEAAYDEARRGALTLPAWLMGHANPVHPAPIRRGVTLMEQVLCEPTDAPPPGAAQQGPVDAVDQEGTNRDRVASSTSGVACRQCHQLINPLGFAFEGYDAVAVTRSEDNDLPVDASGTYAPWIGDSLDFDDAVELSSQLADHPAVRACYARQWARVAAGVDVPDDDPQLEPLRRALEEADGDVRTFLVEVAASTLLRPGGQAP